MSTPNIDPEEAPREVLVAWVRELQARDASKINGLIVRAEAAEQREAEMRDALSRTTDRLHADVKKAEAERDEARAELERWHDLHSAIRQLLKAEPDWPTHGNAPLAIAAAFALEQRDRDAARAEAARLRGVVEAAKRWERARTAWDEARELWGETGAEPEYRALDAAGDETSESADALSAAVRALEGEKP